MCKKVLKVLAISFVVFMLSTSFVYATSDINFDLPESNNLSSNNSEAITNAEDSTTNNIPVSDDEISDNTNLAETLQPSGISSTSDTGLNITNIINILLITVGVILILLAIAILIRLKE